MDPRTHRNTPGPLTMRKTRLKVITGNIGHLAPRHDTHSQPPARPFARRWLHLCYGEVPPPLLARGEHPRRHHRSLPWSGCLAAHSPRILAHCVIHPHTPPLPIPPLVITMVGPPLLSHIHPANRPCQNHRELAGALSSLPHAASLIHTQHSILLPSRLR